MGKLLRVVNREQCIGCYSCMYACARTWYGVISPEQAALRVKVYAGMEGAFSVRPCYGCADPDCARACPSAALTPRAGGGVNYKAAACTHCGACVAACVPKAMQWDHARREPMHCRQCGICTQFCPNNVIAMVETAPADAATLAAAVAESK